ncbi:HK97 gp10 family phage protein [Geothrix campi]|uniref:HK97 gp10 family phage protein n=1 Tax=Geothrix campi TaxID=2966450 RepID=UPI0021491652|nr:HK97 gp10 family phage protein [Geothrix sp. SG10]
MSLDVRFVGDDKVIANLKGMGPKVVAAGKASIARSTMKVLAKAKQKVSGEVLKNRTGTLRRAINQRIEEAGGRIVGTVGIKLRYAAAHEYGFKGTVTVRAHLRMMKVAWGRPVKQPRKIEVGAHTMKMNLPERSFLRSSLRELRSDIIADMQASVAKAVAK